MSSKSKAVKADEPAAPSVPLRKPKVETKNVRHDFGPEERGELGAELARQIGTVREIEMEFDQVKASYKARTAEATARIDSLSTALMNSFEMRAKRCVVVCVPTIHKKYFVPEESFYRDGAAAQPAAVEDMKPEDYQPELIESTPVEPEAETWEARDCFDLFPSTANDFGRLTVARHKVDGTTPLWFAALSIRIGSDGFTETLSTEGTCAKKRADIIERKARQALRWMDNNLPEAAEGFTAPIRAAVDAQKEREE